MALPRIPVRATNLYGGMDTRKLDRWTDTLPTVSPRVLAEIERQIRDVSGDEYRELSHDEQHGLYMLARRVMREKQRRAR